MLRKIVLAKIHRACVTECNPDYVGSITIDAELLAATGMRPSECVLIADCENGNRFETYIIEGDPGSGVIGLNGAAAKLVGLSHHLIIIAYGYLNEKELDTHTAPVIVVDENNSITQKLTYDTHLIHNNDT